MEWLILAVVYVSIGIGVSVWYIRGKRTIASDQKQRSMKILVLLPELCLFWPVALFFELKCRRATGQVANTHIESK